MKNLASLTKNIGLSNFSRLAFPYKLTFSITSRCNSKCKTCYIWRRQSSGELTGSEIERFFVKSNAFNWIDLTGGEIFLRDDLTEIIKSILLNCKNLFLLHFPTNGMLTDRIVRTVKEVMPFFKRKKLIITVSLDGDEGLHDDIRGVPGAYKKTIGTFKELKKIRDIGVYLGMTLSSYNYLQIDRIFKSVKEEYPALRPGDFHFNITHESDFQYENKKKINPCDPKLLMQVIEKIISRKGFSLSPVSILEYCYLRMIKQYLISNRVPVVCKALSASCYMDSKGDVYPCSLYDRRIGNIKDSAYDLKAVWKNVSNNGIASEIKEKRCPGCWTPCEAYQSILGSIMESSFIIFRQWQ